MATNSIQAVSFGHPKRVCVAFVCVRVGFTSERATSVAFDSMYDVGGAGSTEACGVGCAELEVLNASRKLFWPIYAKPGNEAATAEPTLGASRRDGKA